jgi:uncharacterized membrane protein YidH (DUF202 family)
MLLNPIPLLVGLVLIPIAMALVFLGAYEEYSHHFIDKKKPLKLAIEAAAFALILFGTITLAMSLIFKN